MLENPKYRPDIDGLRAVAVVSVVAFHAFPGKITGGFIGVDVFFVISGYLISTILFDNLDRGTFTFREFYLRRIRRIFPALIIVLAATLGLGWMLLFDGEYRRLATHVGAGASFLSNLILWNESGYFDLSSVKKPLLHLWSLGVEEQFYIAWPLTVWLVWRLRVPALLAIAVISALSIAWGIHTASIDSAGSFYSPLVRLWELLAGAALAYPAIRERAIPRHRAIATVMSLAGLVLVGEGCLRLSSNSAIPVVVSMVPVVGAMLVIGAGPSAPLNRFVLAHPLAVRIGLISYPLYLWHWPLISFLYYLYKIPSAGEKIAVVTLSVILATATYRFVEMPLRRAPSRRSALRLTLAMGGLLAVSVLIVAAGLGTRLGADVFPSEVNRSYFTSSRTADDSCRRLLGRAPVDEEVCITNSVGPEVLIGGDSHAMALFSSILAGRVPLKAVLIAGHACRIYPTLIYTPDHTDNYGNNCMAITEDLISAATDIPSVRTVVIVTASGRESPVERSKWRSADRTLSEFDAGSIGGEALLSALERTGRRVIYLRDVPKFSHAPSECVPRLPGVSAPDCRLARNDYDHSVAKYAEIVAELRTHHPEVTFVDPTPLFCNLRYCSPRDDHEFLYEDTHHLSVYGSERLIETYLAGYLAPDAAH